MTGTPEWLRNSAATGFGIDHLPIGIALYNNQPRLMIAIGEYAINLAALLDQGEFGQQTGLVDCATKENVNAFLSLGATAHKNLRWTLQSLLISAPDRIEKCLHSRKDLKMICPLEPRSFVDFYSSEDHAKRCAKLPGGSSSISEAWYSMPLGYYSCAGAFIADGAQFQRPMGQLQTGAGPKYQATKMLDFEMEVGFVLRKTTIVGETISSAQFEEAVFGALLLNDWTARDFQGFENKPLGPFHSKSFATQTASWITPIEALIPFKTAHSTKSNIASYLTNSDPFNYEIKLSASIQSKKMQKNGSGSILMAECEFEKMYWSPAQQLAHMTANGAPVEAGDIFGSGTVSGPDHNQMGCLLERAAVGLEKIQLTDGTARRWLENGDSVILSGEARKGKYFIKLADCRGETCSNKLPLKHQAHDD